MLSSNNLPLGAKEDPLAPFNEPLNIEHKRFISVTISYYDTVELPKDVSDIDINRAFNDKILGRQFPKKFDIDDFIILEE